ERCWKPARTLATGARGRRRSTAARSRRRRTRHARLVSRVRGSPARAGARREHGLGRARARGGAGGGGRASAGAAGATSCPARSPDALDRDAPAARAGGCAELLGEPEVGGDVV